MKKFLVLVLTEPTEGREDEFNDYYEHVHLKEVLETTSWLSAERYKLAAEVGEGAPLPYLAAYEAEGESAQAVLDDLSARRAERQQSGALNKRTGRVWVFEATGLLHQREKV